MIPFSIPSYDADEPEGSKSRGSGYTSFKDIKWIIVIIIVFIALSYPIYKAFAEQRNKHVCSTHLHGIGQAVLLYAALHDDRLPPLYAVGDNFSPALLPDVPEVWASALSKYTTTSVEFRCPSATDEETMSAVNLNPDQPPLELTYGMYSAMSAIPYLLLSSQVDTVLFVETSNYGAEDSFNPVPYTTSDGVEVPFDAFSVAYNTGNFDFDSTTQWVTRLAFRGAGKSGYLGEGVRGRHKQGLNMIYLDGHRGLLQPDQAHVKYLSPDLVGRWRTR